jgi:hypothetical protein
MRWYGFLFTPYSVPACNTHPLQYSRLLQLDCSMGPICPWPLPGTCALCPHADNLCVD